MKMLSSDDVRVCLDERWPRIPWFGQPQTDSRLPGERTAVAPRLYLFRKSDRVTLTTDDVEIEAVYRLRLSDGQAVYQASVTWDGRPAADFEIALELAGPDLTIRLQNVREHDPYRFLSLRFPHLVSATSTDPPSTLLTCGWQGRLLDPKKCKPQLIDYNWVCFIARLCGAAYRPDLMVTIDVPGYDDILVQEVWQYSRIAGGETLASLGAELMYRQRKVEGPREYRFLPPSNRMPKLELLDEPVQCAPSKEVRLHAIAPPRGAALDWTAAAKYFQALVPATVRPEPRYNDTLVYKIQLAHREKPIVSVNECESVLRRVHNLTDGMRQVCYLAFFQYKGGENGFPEMFEVYPPLGTKADVRRLIRSGPKYKAIVSFHENLNVYENESASFDPEYTLRTFDGRMFCGWVLPDFELFSISMPAFKKKAVTLLKRIFKDYGITQTYHLDTFSCSPYFYDMHPRHPYNATQFVQSHREIAEEIKQATGVDLTSEGLTDPFVGHIGHVWWLFNEGTVWEGEEPVPLANFIYHGATSWNSGKAKDEHAILASLIQGGGAGVEYPFCGFDAAELADNLHLVQVPYNRLRQCKWTGYRRTGSIVRVNYAPDPGSARGPGSYIEVDYDKPGYRVVVDGRLIAKDFTTVYPGPKPRTFLAYSRNETELNWPAPVGWKNGIVPAVVLTESGPGIRVPARIEKGRLRLKLQAHQPVRLGPSAP